MSEATHQKHVVKWFNATYPAYAGLLAAFNNSEYVADRRKAKMVGAERKRLGVVAGMPDLILLVPRIKKLYVLAEYQYGFKRIERDDFIPGLFIEMKDTRGKLQPNQKAMHELLRTQNFEVETCYGWPEAIGVIKEYMNEQKVT